MKSKLQPRGLRTLTLLSVLIFICVYLGSGVVFGANAPWLWLGILSVLTLIKLVAIGSFALKVLFLNFPIAPQKPTGPDYEFTIQREGRPYTFNVVPDVAPQTTPVPKKVVFLFGVFAIGLGLLPEGLALGPAHQLWVLDTGASRPGVVTHLRTAASGRSGSNFYVAYTYQLPTEQKIEREQKISETFYQQLEVSDPITVRYRPETPGLGYVEDPNRTTVLLSALGLPMLLNILSGGLALLALRSLLPDLWRSWQRRRAQANGGIISS